MDFCLLLEISVKMLIKNISKNLNSEYCQKFLDHAKKSTRDTLKAAVIRSIETTAEATGDLIGNKIADRITKVSKTLPNNNSEIDEEKTFWESFISPKLRHKNIDYLRLKEESY